MKKIKTFFENGFFRKSKKIVVLPVLVLPLFIFFLNAIAKNKSGKKASCCQPKCNSTKAIDARQTNAKPLDVILTNNNDLPTLLLSSDFGDTWQDISVRMPQTNGITHLLANDNELYAATVEGYIYHCPDVDENRWVREYVGPYLKTELVTGIYAGRNGPYISVLGRGLFQKIPATGFWQSIGYDKLNEAHIHDVCELNDGSLLVASAAGMFKSDAQKRHWKQVYASGWATDLAVNENAVIASAQPGILRSTDGEHWTTTLKDEAAIYHTLSIGGQFKAIRSRIPFHENTTDGALQKHMKIRFTESSDGGSTWSSSQAAGFMPVNFDNVEINDSYLYATHPEGISRSSDGGKSWKMIYEKPKNSVIMQIRLSSGNGKLYALTTKGGC